MNAMHRFRPLILMIFAMGLWAGFLVLMTLCLRWLGTSFPWVVLSSLVAAWGVWTVVIGRSRRRPLPETVAKPALRSAPAAEALPIKVG